MRNQSLWSARKALATFVPSPGLFGVCLMPLARNSIRFAASFGLAVSLFFGAVADLSACTLWAAVVPETGGTIISKNRDWKPDHRQILNFNRKGRYAYFGLYAVGNDSPGLKEGVNEKGLCVVTATAGSIPEDLRKQHRSKRGGAMSSILANYATCDEILANADKIFRDRSPGIMMISDRKKILTVEIGLNGRYALKVTESGHAAHTNHFLDESLSDCNIKIGKSSDTRYKRITELLEKSTDPFDIATFVKMAKDRNAGPNNSIWRTGEKSATLSSWILETPAQGDPKLHLVMANPGEEQKEFEVVLDKKFWAIGL